ncbi:protein DA1 [Acinetobacter sichuanensis]|uniref:protein DA1 n=1 Tax=Acinetobacter sichuanensis TaxID=2136183 RepID=UPI00280DFD8A|nr:protein DA1 [Acinetobacter sichuanensis]MDQ9023010.1 protein DA1 [Acinetobacter sichuanensis]
MIFDYFQRQVLYPCYYCQHQHFKHDILSYADGRMLCKDCAKHIIVSRENLQVVAQWVLKQIEDLGLKFTRGHTYVSLVSKEKMISLGFDQAEGLATNIIATDMFFKNKHLNAQIYVIYGMPTANLVWVLSHEIGHVLVSQHQYQFNTREAEEGFCQLIALLVSQKSQNPLMPRVLYKEFNNPDPVYGDELRKAYEAYKQQGFSNYFRAFI